MKARLYSLAMGAVVVALTLGSLPATLGGAAEKEERSEGKGKKVEAKKAAEPEKEGEEVALSQVPGAVREALEKACKGATVRKITKENEGGKTLYDIEVTRDGRAFEFDIAADGEVISREEQVELARLPVAVRQTIERATKGAKLGTIMKGLEAGKITYEAEVTLKGKTSDVEVAEDGKLIAKTAEAEDKEEKAGAKKERGKREKTEKKEQAERKEMKAEKKEKGEREEARQEKKAVKGEKEKGERKDGKKGEKEDGEKEAKVAFDKLPKAVQKTLKREGAGGKLGDITKDVEEGKVIYEAELELDDEEYEVEVAADGKLIKKVLDEEDKDEQNAKEKKPEKREVKSEKKEKGEREEGKREKEGREKGERKSKTDRERD